MNIYQMTLFLLVQKELYINEQHKDNRQTNIGFSKIRNIYQVQLTRTTSQPKTRTFVSFTNPYILY